MELLSLDSNFRPNKLIENYNSLIWTERYSMNGDFELKSYDINGTRALMPRESVVSLRDSNVPMIVEQHKIRKPSDGAAYIEVVGRSYESVLERRLSVSVLKSDAVRPPWIINAMKESDAAYKAMRMVLGDPQIRSNLPALPPAVSPLDAIPELNLILPADYDTGLDNEYEIKPGYLYGTLIEMLQINHHGMKAVRPASSAPLSKNTIDIEIYNGADLREYVAFDTQFDQFEDSAYLLTAQGSANVAYVYGGNGSSLVRKNDLGDEPFGLKRRLLLIDEQGDDYLSTPDIRRSRGLVELYKNNVTALFDGETSIMVAEKFHKPHTEGGYSLGDIVSLIGEFELSRNVRVSEFIRAYDDSGYKAFPTFEAIEE